MVGRECDLLARFFDPILNDPAFFNKQSDEPLPDDSQGSHAADSSQQQQQHLLKLNALNLLDVTSPTAGGDHSGHKVQNRNDYNEESAKNSSPEADTVDKKSAAIGSLSGERTHGLSNSSGLSPVNGKDTESSAPLNISSILSQMSKINGDQGSML